MASEPMWGCETCSRQFDGTLAAIDHALRFDAADIWPVYSEEYDGS